MRDLIEDELTGTFAAVSFEVAAFRILASLLLAGAIGLEREWRRKPAGLRTHMLVSLAACLYFIVGRELSLIDFGAVGEMRVDPLRLIEAVTAGVAFLVAGIIITSGGKVQNITTGASLWLAGAIGLATGAGLIPLAALVTVTVIAVLAILGLIERSGDGEAADEPPSGDGTDAQSSGRAGMLKRGSPPQ
jgi:putative Mg2+ transporter-C (MgtC) family protein